LNEFHGLAVKPDLAQSSKPGPLEKNSIANFAGNFAGFGHCLDKVRDKGLELRLLGKAYLAASLK
jgi:hypothetical protein